MHQRGFTLIELLIVIGVLVALAGLLVPAVGVVQRAAHRAETSARLTSIEAGVGRFQQMNGFYPQANGSQQSVLCSDAGELKNLNSKLLTDLQSVDRGSFHAAAKCVKNGQIVDYWGNFFRYRPATLYPRSGSGTGIDNDTPPRPDDFQLWSPGLNEMDEAGAGDDLNNWKR